MAKPDKLRTPLDEGLFENVGRLPDPHLAAPPPMIRPTIQR